MSGGRNASSVSKCQHHLLQNLAKETPIKGRSLHENRTINNHSTLNDGLLGSPGQRWQREVIIRHLNDLRPANGGTNQKKVSQENRTVTNHPTINETLLMVAPIKRRHHYENRSITITNHPTKNETWPMVAPSGGMWACAFPSVTHRDLAWNTVDVNHIHNNRTGKCMLVKSLSSYFCPSSIPAARS